MSDPDLKSLAVQALAGLLDTVKSAKDFTMEQAPDVLRQMVAYHATISWLAVIAGVLGIIACGVAAWLGGRAMDKIWKDDDPMNYGFPAILGIILALVFGIMPILYNLPNAICATFTPKYFIITKLAELLK